MMTTQEQLATEVAAMLCGHQGAQAIVVECTRSTNEDGKVRRMRYIVGCSMCGEMVGWVNEKRNRLLLFESETRKLVETIGNLNATLAVVHEYRLPHFVHKEGCGISIGVDYGPLRKPDVTCPRCLKWIEDGRPMVVRGD